MRRLHAIWILLRLPKSALYEALDTLLAVRAFYWNDPNPVEAAPSSLPNKHVVKLNPPVVRADFPYDPDDI